MASWRALQDLIGPSGYVHAGETFSTADDWRPPNAVDPLDNSAVTAFYAAGVQMTPLARQQWSNISVSAPVTYWQAIPNTNPTLWALTGLGAGLPAIGM